MANSFKNAGMTLTTTGRTTLYTCPAGKETVIHALYLSNTDGVSPVSVDIEITVDGGTTYQYVGKTLLVPEDSTLIPDKPINLESGDILAITASAANKLDAVCAILEITP
jgi:hypothetical protein